MAANNNCQGVRLQYFSGNPRAGFCIGQSMVMLFQVVSAEGGHGVQLVVLRPRESATGGPQRIIEIIVGIIHLVDPEDGFQAVLVERLVVGDEGESLNQRGYLCLYLAEYGRIVGILAGESVHLCAETAVVVGLRLDE